MRLAAQLGGGDTKGSERDKAVPQRAHRAARSILVSAGFVRGNSLKYFLFSV